MASKKSQENFDQMKMSADSLMGKLDEEGKEATGASRTFRRIVLKTLELHMRMIVYIYQYVRYMQEQQRQLDEESSFEAMNATVDLAISSGTKILPIEAGTGAREVTTPLQTSATLPSRNGEPSRQETPVSTT
ncbi:MAG: hypothetical protein AAB394_03485 [Patescibacteria group bacterium]